LNAIHLSPFYLNTTDVKLESPLDHAIALDLVTSVIAAFQDSQSLAAHNLWNLYMGEELRDVLPHMIVNSAMSQMC